jgi:NADPH2:quinone reductase
MATTMAMRVTSPGGPEVLSWEPVELAPPGPGEAQVRHTAVGLNFIEIYQRTGLYPLPGGVPGNEGAGVVEAVGAGVTDMRPGDRVAYGNAPPGAYAERRNVPADKLVRLPDGIDDKVAASIMLKGMTAEYLLCRTYPVKAGETVLFHAAAGGTGSLAVQWARSLGATVIGTVSTDAKAALARRLGCHHVIVTGREDFVQRVRELTGGAGVHVVYDSIGKDTLARSFECLRPRGMVVLFGQSSGPVTSFDPALLAKGSHYLTRPSLFAYAATRAELVASANALFAKVLSGDVTPEAPREYRLRDAARAHRDLESRATTGPGLLVP